MRECDIFTSYKCNKYLLPDAIAVFGGVVLCRTTCIYFNELDTYILNFQVAQSFIKN